MRDITEVFRSQIPYVLKGALLLRAGVLGEQNFMNSNIVHCNSLDELVKHYEEIKPCYVYVHAVRFRNPDVAYENLTGENLKLPTKRKEFMLQDRYGEEWCWGEDDTSWSKPKIKDKFSDYEILDMVFGKANFEVTPSGPIKHIRVIGYKGRIINPEQQRDELVDTLPAYVL